MSDSEKEIMSKVNPFYLRHAGLKNDLIVWSQPYEAYYYVLSMFLRYCPRGYVELLFILTNLYPDRDICELRKMAQKMKVEQVAMLDYGTKKCERYFEQFFLQLHDFWETKMNHDAFKQAIGYLNNTIEMLNSKK